MTRSYWRGYLFSALGFLGTISGIIIGATFARLRAGRVMNNVNLHTSAEVDRAIQSQADLAVSSSSQSDGDGGGGRDGVCSVSVWSFSMPFCPRCLHCLRAFPLQCGYRHARAHACLCMCIRV